MAVAFLSTDGGLLHVSPQALALTAFGDPDAPLGLVDDPSATIPVDYDAAALRPFFEALELYAGNGRDADAFARIIATHAALGVSLYSMVRVADFFGMAARGDFFKCFIKTALDAAGFDRKPLKGACSAFIGGRPLDVSTEFHPRRFRCDRAKMPACFTEFNDSLLEEAPPGRYGSLAPDAFGEIAEKKAKRVLFKANLAYHRYSFATLPCGAESVE